MNTTFYLFDYLTTAFIALLVCGTLLGLAWMILSSAGKRRKSRKGDVDMTAIAKNIESMMPDASAAGKARMLQAALQELAEPVAIEEIPGEKRSSATVRLSEQSQ